MSPLRTTRALTAAAVTLLVVAAPAAAISPTARIGGSISPDHGRPGTPLRLTTRFNLDPGPGEAAGTVNRVVLQFPSNGVHNGSLFPSCSADTINRAGGSFSRCPRGSQVGRGTLRGDVPNLEITNAPGRVTLFNGPGGRSITVHIYLTNPALISIAYEAPIVRTSGRYGYTMTNNVPEGLQTLIEPDSFAGLRWLNATVGATIRAGGRTRGFIEAKRCPSSGRVPIAGQFYFNEDNSQAEAVGEIKCRP